MFLPAFCVGEKLWVKWCQLLINFCMSRPYNFRQLFSGLAAPSKHKTFVGPTSSTLTQHCIQCYANVLCLLSCMHRSVKGYHIFPANMMHQPIAGSTLAHCLRRCTNIEPASVNCYCEC